VAHLITGGTGFIGVELARKLLDRGAEVVLFDLQPDMAALGGLADRLTVLRGDVSGWPEVLNAVNGRSIESIFHLGALLSVPADENPWAAYRVNADGVMHVLEAARIFGVPKVIFSSSMAVHAGNTGPIDESMSPEAWRDLIKSLMAEIFSVGKKAGLWVANHCCGDLRPIIPGAEPRAGGVPRHRPPGAKKRARGEAVLHGRGGDHGPGSRHQEQAAFHPRGPQAISEGLTALFSCTDL
jgi:GDP-D-mannose dehydratase